MALYLPAKTPNGDRLANDGMKFAKFYATLANRSPTRASNLTGHPSPFVTPAFRYHLGLQYHQALQSMNLLATRIVSDRWASTGRLRLGNSLQRLPNWIADNTTVLLASDNGAACEGHIGD